jgi:hypothetical protein
MNRSTGKRMATYQLSMNLPPNREQILRFVPTDTLKLRLHPLKETV